MMTSSHRGREGGAMHYEVELRELTYKSDGTGGLRVTGFM
jgi:hypothetical protein